MNFNGNFRRIGFYDIEEIKARVAQIPEAVWETNPERREKYPVHTETRSIRLIFDYFRH